MKSKLACLVLAGIGLVPALAQEGTAPAPVLNIAREMIKEGRNAAHLKVEGEWAATLRKANFPQNYVGMTSLSGPSEVWFLEPLPSFAANEEYEKISDKEPLKSATASLDLRDGEFRTGSRNIWAVYRPDLSYHPEKYNPGKTRFVDVGTFRVKMGADEEFQNGTRTYFGAFDKGHVDVCALAYQVVAGAPSGTYLFFTLMDSMKVLDGYPDRMKAMMTAMGEKQFSEFMKSSGNVLTSIEDNLFEVNPSISYVPQKVADTDPAFWRPKPEEKKKP